MSIMPTMSTTRTLMAPSANEPPDRRRERRTQDPCPRGGARLPSTQDAGRGRPSVQNATQNAFWTALDARVHR